MIKAGRIQTLTVSRTSDYGLYLADEEHNEVLLPNRYTSLADKTGDAKEVFVYHDSEDRLVATTEQPTLFGEKLIGGFFVPQDVDASKLLWVNEGQDEAYRIEVIK